MKVNKSNKHRMKSVQKEINKTSEQLIQKKERKDVRKIACLI